jgi:hypothetical protein
MASPPRGILIPSVSGDSTLVFTTASLLRELNNADSTPPADPPVAHPNLRPIHSTAFGRAIVGLDASPAAAWHLPLHLPLLPAALTGLLADLQLISEFPAAT